MIGSKPLACAVIAGLSGLFLYCDTARSADAVHTHDTALDKVIVIGDHEPASEPSDETEKLLKIPGSFGDPLQAVYTLPGVLQTQEVGGAPAVRGSGPDDNTFLIDFLPAAYIFHDFGFSIFNENLLRDFGVKTSGFGARYGHATGAVFDVTLREPRAQPWNTTIDASFLRVGAMVEGELTDSQAMYVSYRESLIHLLLKARANALKDKDDVSFSEYPRARDFQAKYSWNIDAHNRLSVLGVGAQDATGIDFGSTSDLALIDPGSAGDARLKTQFFSEGVNWLFEDGGNRLHTALGHMDQSQHLSSGGGAEFVDTDVDSWIVKSHYDRVLSNSHTVGVGAEYQHSRFDYNVRVRYRSCTDFTPDCIVNPGPLTQTDNSAVINDTEAFIEDRWQALKSVVLTTGVHQTRNDYLNESYFEPRVAAEWQVNSSWSLHSSWGKYHQLPQIEQIVPVLGNPQLLSEAATHYVAGVTQRLDGGWSWTSDFYYKQLSDLVVDVNTNERYVNAATGTAYGAELMINKNYDPNIRSRLGDRLYGWLSLSLSKSKRHDELNNTTAVFEYDTPVVANLVVNYKLNAAWDAGIRWMLRSGLPYTPITGNTPNPEFPGFYIPTYGTLNSARAPTFHRLDLRVERALRMRKLRGSFYIDIINVYDRRNGGIMQYKPVAGSSNYTLQEQDSLPLLPSVGVKLTF